MRGVGEVERGDRQRAKMWAMPLPMVPAPRMAIWGSCIGDECSGWGAGR